MAALYSPVRFAAVAVSSLLIAMLPARVGHAQTTYVWSGTTGPPFLLSSASNWVGSIAPPASGSSILSFGTTAGATTPNASLAYSIHRLEFHDALPYTLSGASLTIGTGGIGSSCSANCEVSNTIVTGSKELSIHADGPGPIRLNGALSGMGRLLKHGPGTLTLSGANTFAGGTSVRGGTLRAGADNVIPAGTVSVRSGTLDLNGFSDVIGPGAVADTGLVMGAWPTDGSAAGTTATVHSPDTPFGISTLGTFIALDPAGSPGTAEITGVLNLGTTAGTRTIDVGNSAATDVDLKISADIVNLTGISGTAPIIDKVGQGRLELSGAGSFPRPVRVLDGTLRVSNSLALGASGPDNSTIVTNGTTIELSPGVEIGDEWLSLIGSGAGASGALRALAGGTSEWAGPIDLSDSGVRIRVDAGGVLICDQVFSTNSPLAVSGGGTLIFPNANEYEGLTTIESGTTLRVTNASGIATGTQPTVVNAGARLEGTGQIVRILCFSGGIVEPGVSAPGTLRVVSVADLQSGSKLRIKATSKLPAGCARLAVTGNASLAGTLEFSTTFTPALGDSFVVLTCGSRTGTFKNASLPALPNSRAWVLQHTPTSVVLRVIATVDVTPPAATLTELERVAPNPFVHETTIAYALAKPGRVDLQVFDASGRRVATLVDGAETPAGRHQAAWSGRDAAGRVCSPGLYWIRLSVDGVAHVPRRVTLSR